MNKTYYKVCYETEGRLVSIGSNEDYIIKYELEKEIVAPEGTKLFVFETLEHAQSYKGVYSRYKIFECECPEGQIGYGAWYKYDLNRFWKEYNQQLQENGKIDYSAFSMFLTDQRAILVDSVKLLREASSYY